MNSAIELHDSVVGAISQVGEQVIVFFSQTCVHKSEGRPGEDEGTGWVQAAAFRFASAEVDGHDPAEYPADLSGGELALDGVVFPGLIPTSFRHEGQVALRLDFMCDPPATIRGHNAELLLIGEPVYVEDFRV